MFSEPLRGWRHVIVTARRTMKDWAHEVNLLHVAAAAGRKKCAQVLLDSGAYPGVADSEGRTPAMLAALRGKATKPVLDVLPELAEPKGSELATDLLMRAISDGD